MKTPANPNVVDCQMRPQASPEATGSAGLWSLDKSDIAMLVMLELLGTASVLAGPWYAKILGIICLQLASTVIALWCVGEQVVRKKPDPPNEKMSHE